MAYLHGIATKMSGSVGQFTFKRMGGATIVSEKVTNITNPRSASQQSQRTKWEIFRPHLLPSEVGGDFAPLVGLPFQYGRGVAVRLQPPLGSLYQLEQRLGLGIAGQGGLAALLLNPEHRVAAVAVEGEVKALLLQQGQTVHNG